MRQPLTPTWFLLIVSLVLNFTCKSASLASHLPPLSIEDVLKMKLLGTSPQVSPDGTQLAFAITYDPGLQTETLEPALMSDIVLADVATGEIRNITRSVGRGMLLTWSPDGHYLAFVTQQPGFGESLWLWEATSGEVRELSGSLRVMANELQWTPDSERILLTTMPESPTGKVAADENKNGGEGPGACQFRSSVTVYRARMKDSDKARTQSDPWSLEDAGRDLVAVDALHGKVDVIARNRRVSRFEVFPDGSGLAFSSPQRFENLGSQQVVYDLIVVSFASNQEHIVASGIRLGLAGRFSVSPDSSQIAYRANGSDETARDIYLIPAVGGTPRNLTQFGAPKGPGPMSEKLNWPYSFVPLWNRAGDHLYYITNGQLWETSVQGVTRCLASMRNRQIIQLISQSDNTIWTSGSTATIVVAHGTIDKRDGFYKIDLPSGEITQLLEQEKCYTCSSSYGQAAEASRNGLLMAYVSEDSRHPPDVYITDSGFKHPRQLTHLNPLLDGVALGATLVVDWLDDDGRRLQGALLLPSNYQTGKSYPLIVVVYGGGSPSDKSNMFGGPERSMPYFNTQLFAARGYAVFMPDAPQGLGTPMFDLAKTVLPGVNKVIDVGIADPSRIGIMGHSYGGYSALALAVQTTRFRAAVEADGFGDLLGEYGEMDKDGNAYGISLAETEQELMGGTPWQYRDRYIENSPTFYLDRIVTPLLIVHGDEDSASAPFLADQLFVELRRLGKNVEYAKYHGEGHTIVEHRNQVDLSNRLLDWFHAYLSEAPPAK